jgi:hypothetical protein
MAATLPSRDGDFGTGATSAMPRRALLAAVQIR